jgi:hypothetical protein
MQTIFRVIIFSFLVSGCQSITDLSSGIQCADYAKNYLGSNRENDQIYIKNCKACMATGKSIDQCDDGNRECGNFLAKGTDTCWAKYK